MSASNMTSSSTSLPGTTPSVGELSAEAKEKRSKSPPLAFEKTPNDSLAPLTLPGSQTGPITDDSATLSPIMGRLPRAGEEDRDLQVVLDQQAAALQLLHDAFAAERQAWNLEKERLYCRIASLEKLLKTADGYSPAKSPILSPLSTSNITSPQSRAIAQSNRLPSIAEDEPDILPLAQRRDNPPLSISMPSPPPQEHHREAAVSFQGETPGAVIVEEISVSLPADAERSPPPLINRMAAGHTPLRAPRPLTPPPKNSLSMDGIEDTPTRTNTQMNALMKTDDDDGNGDKELSGPLNMPELPNRPDATNFTLEALSKRLEQIEKNPTESKPMVFNERSPGLASPVAEAATAEDGKVQTTAEDAPLAPPTSTALNALSASELSSNARTPSATLSPLTQKLSREESEDKVQADFESGGIKLKKKLSTNFGAPFGQLGGFGRRSSHDWQ